TDDVSGVDSANVQFISPSTNQYVYGYFVRSGGATYTAIVTVPKSAEAGTWTLGYVSLRDQAGNYTNVYQPTLTMLGLSASFQVTSTATADTAPPVLTAIAASPASVDVGTDSAAVTVTATITDDVSGVDSADRKSTRLNSSH